VSRQSLASYVKSLWIEPVIWTAQAEDITTMASLLGLVSTSLERLAILDMVVPPNTLHVTNFLRPRTKLYESLCSLVRVREICYNSSFSSSISLGIANITPPCLERLLIPVRSARTIGHTKCTAYAIIKEYSHEPRHVIEYSSPHAGDMTNTILPRPSRQLFVIEEGQVDRFRGMGPHMAVLRLQAASTSPEGICEAISEAIGSGRLWDMAVDDLGNPSNNVG
jgi:hypothetical protein